MPIHVWLLAIAYAPLTMVMFQAFSGLAQIFDDSDYRTMILVNAVVLVAFPPLLWSIAANVNTPHAIVAAGPCKASVLQLPRSPWTRCSAPLCGPSAKRR